MTSSRSRGSSVLGRRSSTPIGQFGETRDSAADLIFGENGTIPGQAEESGDEQEEEEECAVENL